MQKEKNGREEFNELNIKVLSERWFEISWFGISDLCKDICKILLFVWAPL